jgi:hypothetical protein
MLRTLSAVAALQFLALTSAWACSGQVGAVIFQDSFTDDSGGWDQGPPQSVIKPPAFVFTLDAQNGGTAAQNLTFNATDGDYCMDVALPPPIAADNQFYAGIEFWAADYNDVMNAEVSSAGNISVSRKVAGKWTVISTVNNVPAFKSGANAVNSLRITALAGVITVYLNGTQVKLLRAQEPANSSLRFGIIVEMDKTVASGTAPPVLVKSYSVTAGK